MGHLFVIWTVARYETRLLWRSWAFRLFSGSVLLFLFIFNLVVISPMTNAPHYLRAVSGHLPLFNLKLLNLYQGVIVSFLAAEFIKRDRQQDTVQTIFVRSFSNLDYVLGKLLGLVFLFGGLHMLALSGIAAGHYFFATVPFAWQPYVFFPLIVTAPTLIFIVGLTWLLTSLLRNQALVSICLLGISFFCFAAGQHFYYVADIFSFFIPLTYSDFTGFGHLNQLASVRSMHVLFGLAGMGMSILFFSRLRQSSWAVATAILLVLSCSGGIAWISTTYLSQQKGDLQYRQDLRALSRTVASLPAPKLIACQIAVDRPGENIVATAELVAVNGQAAALDSLLFTLNPGLQITTATINGRTVPLRREQHLVWLKPEHPLAPGDSCRVQLAYRGVLDQRFCYLDIDDKRFTSPYTFSFFSPPKSYAFFDEKFVHLTPESGWYPVAGLSPGAAFPSMAARNHYRFELTTTMPLAWAVFSQGAATVDTVDQQQVLHFRPQQPLAQISLTAGPYERRQVTVDDIDYALATLPDHDYFSAYFDSVGPALPEAIRGLKNDYEAALGLEYTHARLSLVEVPIQFFAYRRLWTIAQETVQPEIVFLPEMGALLEGADFRRMRRQSTRSQERANQAESAEEIQADYLRTFARLDLLGLQDAGRTDFSQEQSLESRWYVLPQYVSYATSIASPRWPVLNYAFEAYFQERIKPPANNWSRQWRGLTTVERANIELGEQSLAELLAFSEKADQEEKEEDATIRETAIRAKGRQLLLLLAAEIGIEKFNTALTDFAMAHRHTSISDHELLELLEELGAQNAEERLEIWYGQAELPGYSVENVEAYLVRDGERTRTQVTVELGNPTDTDGLVKLNFRFRQESFDSWRERQRTGWDYSRVVGLPAQTKKRVGLLLDEPIAELVVDTYVSRNIPSLIPFSLGEQTLRKNVLPFSGFEDQALAAGDTLEYIVDNEDAGFELLTVENTSRLRIFLLDLFDKEEKKEPYVGLRSWNPPGSWKATTDHRLYGRFVRSSYYKASGEGLSRVAWNTAVGAEGDYEVYFFCGLLDDLRNRERGARSEQTVHFLVYHEDGIDDLQIDRPDLQQGWNLLGTYHLAAGPARVELTDRSTSRIVVADAVKWVKSD